MFGRLLGNLAGRFRLAAPAALNVTVGSGPTGAATTVEYAVRGSLPVIPPSDYRIRLQQVIASGRFKSVADNPDTPENERRTYCNLFVRHVARWFGFTGWNPDTVDGERAADLHRWMAEHPDRWRPLTGAGRYLAARDIAERGGLVVYSHIYPPPTGPIPPGGWSASGHVCVGAPEHALWKSGSWGADVPMVANVGGKEFYGESVSRAFAKPCDGMFVYLG